MALNGVKIVFDASNTGLTKGIPKFRQPSHILVLIIDCSLILLVCATVRPMDGEDASVCKLRSLSLRVDATVVIAALVAGRDGNSVSALVKSGVDTVC